MLRSLPRRVVPRATAVAVARKDDGGAINLPLDGGCLLEWNLVVCVDMSIVI